MGDHYRPAAPLPPPRAGDNFRRGDTYRPSQDTSAPTRNDFRFQLPRDAPRCPADSQHSIPQGPAQRRNRQQNAGGRGRGRGRGGAARFGAHNRALLRSRDDGGTEQLLGVADGSSRFAVVVDTSESEQEEGEDPAVEDRHGLNPRKRVKTQAKADGNSVPKWSNPDPYTSLPPPDESQTKKKDVVKLIRKAKVEQEKTAKSANAVSENADFISFNLDGDDNEESSSEESSADESRTRPYTGSMNEASRNGGFNRRPENPIVEQRKRALYDAAPPPPPNAKKRKLLAGELNGTVVKEWRPREGSEPTPWCIVDHSRTKTMGHWLHKEICDFYDYVKPQGFEDHVRNDLIARIERSIRRRFHDSSIHSFGSYAAGLYLPTADMDLVMLSRQYYRENGAPVYGQRRNELYQILALLVRDQIALEGGEVVWGAKVPIIKFVDRKTDLKVDLSFENMTGLIANETFSSWRAQYPAMPKLVVLIKHFLHMRGLNEVYTGGIGGFTVTCLAILLIATLPSVQSGNMDQEQNLGQLLIEFLDLFGNNFNFENVMIRMDPPRFQPKGGRGPGGKPLKADRLCIIDPNNPDNDISGGSGRVKLIFNCFKNALQDLQERMGELDDSDMSTRSGSSILGSIYAGDYSSFRWQRDRLRRVYEQSIRDSVERKPSPPPQPAQFPAPVETSASTRPNVFQRYAEVVERDPFAITSEPIRTAYGGQFTPINLRSDDVAHHHQHFQQHVGRANHPKHNTEALRNRGQSVHDPIELFSDI